MSLRIPAIKVRQWLPQWDDVQFDEETLRRKPEKWFLICSIPAKVLRRLSGVYRRRDTDATHGQVDAGIQRRLNQSRSDEIGRFLQNGYPCSQLKARELADESLVGNLRKPGWLPTSIVLNILTRDDIRNGERISATVLASVEEPVAGACSIILPDIEDVECSPIRPFEIIDGQHRLMAFNDDVPDDFELPVVAFVGLDISWQAYLFWTINIKPKKISPSLAFDLYPLLRTQEWLEHFGGPIVYREARAQELVELLHSNVKSPWYQRINMLGEKGVHGQVTQAAWIKSLLSTYVKAWDSPEDKIGGFFGQASRDTEIPVPWSRLQQAAFLMFLGVRLREKINERASGKVLMFDDANSLLNTDQGIRGVLTVTNMILCSLYSELKVACQEWGGNGCDDEQEIDASNYYDELCRLDNSLTQTVGALAEALACFDWRSLTAEFSADESAIRDHKAVYRGAGGYRMIREDLLRTIAGNAPEGLLRLAVERLGLVQ